jgi:eukaryotic-like serine/threonine-protein kinase
MGIVYIGHDPFVDRQVAIKVATDQSNQNRTTELARRLFFNEARAAGVLDHPNILRVFDAGEDENGRPYMVMEYIEAAETLRDYVAADRLLPLPRVLELMRQCADALRCAHEHGVVHRDIKPANLLLTRGGVAKVGDFGVAQRMHGDETQVLGWFGSPQYMSPEQARDDEITPVSDIFSLGCVMYELLAGRRAFEAKGISGLLTKLLTEEPTPIVQLKPELPAAVVQILNKCLRKSVSDRYKDAASLVADLDRVLADLDSGITARGEADQLALLGETRFLAGFTLSELKEVLKAGSWRGFIPESELIRSGNRDTALHIVVRGSVAITLHGQRLCVITAGDCVGEIAYVTGVPRTASAHTLERSEILSIEKPPKEWASLGCQLRFARALQVAMAERLWQTSERLVQK